MAGESQALRERAVAAVGVGVGDGDGGGDVVVVGAVDIVVDTEGREEFARATDVAGPVAGAG